MNVVLRSTVHVQEGVAFTVSSEPTERFRAIQEALDKADALEETTKESQRKIAEADEARQQEIARKNTKTAGGKLK